MSEQARKVRKRGHPRLGRRALLQQGPLRRGAPLLRRGGLYFEVRGEDGASVVRFSFEMLEAFKQAVEEDE